VLLVGYAVLFAYLEILKSQRFTRADMQHWVEEARETGQLPDAHHHDNWDKDA